MSINKLSVIRPMFLQKVAKGGRPNASIGVAKGAGSLMSYGTALSAGAVGAVAAVEPFTNAHGRRAYCVSAMGTGPASELAEMEAELRRQLALGDNPPAKPKFLPKTEPVEASTKRRRAAMRVRKKGKVQAEKDERARLDRIGATYKACAPTTEPDLANLKRLMEQNRIVASAKETRGAVSRIRQAIGTNLTIDCWGPVAQSIALAIQACG